MFTRGKLTVLRPLGVGGMASVHLAEMTSGGETRKVAVKQLHPFIASDEASISLLEQEARLAGCIRHPNVVGVVDFIPAASGSSTAPTLVMEWVDGSNLGVITTAMKAAKRALPLDVVVAIASDLLRGLHAAHEARHDGAPLEIVHRDVSPQNVIVGTDGVARLTDFGVARALWRIEATKLGVIKGKLGYMAPEQLEGKVDRRTDIYAAGVVLWELLTGKRFRSLEGEATQVLIQILHGLAAAPSSEGASDALDEIVLRALSRFPEDRFATALEMVDALAAVVAPASPSRVAAAVRELLEQHSSETSEDAVTVDLILDGPTVSSQPVLVDRTLDSTLLVDSSVTSLLVSKVFEDSDSELTPVLRPAAERSQVRPQVRPRTLLLRPLMGARREQTLVSAGSVRPRREHTEPLVMPLRPLTPRRQLEPLRANQTLRLRASPDLDGARQRERGRVLKARIPSSPPRPSARRVVDLREEHVEVAAANA